MPDLLSSRAGAVLREREAELALIDESLQRARAGVGSAVVIEGPAGIGKTRLLLSARERAQALDLRALRARAGELEREFSYGVVRQLFENEFGQVGEAARADLLTGPAALAAQVFDVATTTRPDHGGEVFATLHGLFWLTVNVADRGPLLLSVDDLHWSDVPSLRFLAYLLRRIEGLPLVLIATARPDENSPARSIVHEIAADAATAVLRPQPLSADTVGTLVHDRLGDVAHPSFSTALHEWTAGNPLLVNELIDAVAGRPMKPTAQAVDEVRQLAPEGVSRFVLRRLHALDEPAVSLAQRAAVLGDGAPLDQVAELAGLTYADAARAAQALRRADVLALDDRVTFTHPVARRAIYDSIDAHQREQAHAHAARILAAAGAPPAHVATHLLTVRPRGDPAVIAPLLAAANQAASQGAPDAAATYLARALAEPPPDEQRTQVLLELGVAQARAHPEQAIAHLTEALELMEDEHAIADAALELSNALQFLGRPAAWQEILERVSDRLTDQAAIRRVEAELIWLTSYRTEQYPVAAARLPRIQRQDCGEDVAGRQLLALLASQAARAGKHPERALQMARDALREGTLVHERLAPIFSVPMTVLVHLDHFDEALAVCDAALQRSRHHGAIYLFALASGLRSDLFLRRGALADAEADAQAAVDAISAIHSFHGSRKMLGEISFERGDLSGAAAHLDNPEIGAGAPGSWEAALLITSRSRLRLHQGRLHEAVDDARTAGAWFKAMGTTNPAYAPWRSYAALALLGLDERDEALRLAREQLRLAREWGAPRALGHALTTAGLVEGAETGLALLRHAVDALAGSPAILEHARALTELGATLRRSNHRAEARGFLTTALQLAETCGATGLAQRAREELIATGARPRRAMRSGIDALTPTEHRVSQMAAQGQTNRQIAQALFVTPKTIEVHLSHAYQKLGIRSRSQLPEHLDAGAAENTRLK